MLIFQRSSVPASRPAAPRLPLLRRRPQWLRLLRPPCHRPRCRPVLSRIWFRRCSIGRSRRLRAGRIPRARRIPTGELDGIRAFTGRPLVLGPRRRKGEVVRDRSASSSRRPGRLVLGFLLLALLGVVPIPAARGGDIEAQLEQLLRNAGPGVVKIDVRRAMGTRQRDASGAGESRTDAGPAHPGQRDRLGRYRAHRDRGRPRAAGRYDSSLRPGRIDGQGRIRGPGCGSRDQLDPRARPLRHPPTCPGGRAFLRLPPGFSRSSYPGVVHPLKSLAHLSVSRTEKGIGPAVAAGERPDRGLRRPCPRGWGRAER